MSALHNVYHFSNWSHPSREESPNTTLWFFLPGYGNHGSFRGFTYIYTKFNIDDIVLSKMDHIHGWWTKKTYENYGPTFMDLWTIFGWSLPILDTLQKYWLVSRYSMMFHWYQKTKGLTNISKVHLAMYRPFTHEKLVIFHSFCLSFTVDLPMKKCNSPAHKACTLAGSKPPKELFGTTSWASLQLFKGTGYCNPSVPLAYTHMCIYIIYKYQYNIQYMYIFIYIYIWML